jgi:hypothetical protein
VPYSAPQSQILKPTCPKISASVGVIEIAAMVSFECAAIDNANQIIVEYLWRNVSMKTRLLTIIKLIGLLTFVRFAG